MSQVDEDGFTIKIMNFIIDHKMDTYTAVAKDDKYIVTRCGQKKLKKTTTEWKLLIK